MLLGSLKCLEENGCRITANDFITVVMMIIHNFLQNTIALLLLGVGVESEREVRGHFYGKFPFGSRSKS